MNKTTHIIYIYSMAFIVIAVTIFIGYYGYDYYKTPILERFNHPQYSWFKPSGIFGHGLGIIGTLLILFGVTIYIARKKYGFMEKYLRLKYLLEFHIFLCSLGPVLILFHTSFKFGGIVSIAFWSMIAVVLSGIVGRYIYIQIPRTIEGRELTLNEVKETQKSILNKLKDFEQIGIDIGEILGLKEKMGGLGLIAYLKRNAAILKLKKQLIKKAISKEEIKLITGFVKQEWIIAGRINRLNQMQKLFKYWHVAHMPFALIMLVIVLLHTAITLALGYKWIW
ncbi:MAG: hypothetical protein ACOYMA_03810 [Bacteroidia bacterium]